MLKHYFFALLIFAGAHANAQYKKASFLNKKGRTYEAGATARFLTEGHSIAPGLAYSFGRQHEEKRTFHWFDLEFLLPTKFHYETVDHDTQTPVTVSGKSNLGFAFRYNFGYFLADNSNAKNKLLPFVTGGLGIVFGADAMNTTYSPDGSYDVLKQPVRSDLNLGGNLGVGVVYNFTKTVGMKLSGGYSYQYNFNNDYSGSDYQANGYSFYNFFTSHPYVGLGVRFTIAQND